MSQDENVEANQDALNGLPDKDRKETEEILGEIEKEHADPSKPEEGKPKDEKPEVKPDADGTKKEDGKPDEKTDEKKPENQRREVKLVPAWVLERHKSESEKTIDGLKAQIETLSKVDPSKKGEEGKTSEDEENEIKAMAEKHGYEPDFVKEVIKLSRANNGKIPEEITKGLSKIDELASAREQEAELAQFQADFERLVVPLIKAEYGDDVPKETVEKIKEDLKGIAYSQEYGKIPYDEIYQGKKDFRGVIPPKKKGAEGSRGGTGSEETANADSLDLTKPLPDEDIRKLSDDQFDKYMKNMEAYEKSFKK